ncbi:MAG: DUF1836 domain-containing protein [Tissierellia bacterium]|nr:DUF1836 domain-containing protein [Tissierellia bacterium]
MNKLTDDISIILDFNLPKWEDLPDFEIYINQVITIVDNIFSMIPDDGEVRLTKSMINNYVKWGFIPKPIKRKYAREHVAKLIVITLLKQILTINQIKKGIDLQVASYGVSGAYEVFRENFQIAIKQVYSNWAGKDSIKTEIPLSPKELIAIRAIGNALALRILTELILKEDGLGK